jgi:3-methyladenine DNA glycosylase Mpg
MDLAKQILLNYFIKTPKNTYKITEVEMYLCSKEHNDQYTHCNGQQAKYNRFYAHKYANGTYKSGTWKGLDLCFGKNGAYCGYLIRSIALLNENNDVETFIEGPCKSVNTILNDFDTKTFSEFNNKLQDEYKTSIENIDIFDTESVLHIVSKEYNANIYSGKRIGLSNDYPEFRDRSYRFCMHPEFIKKDKRALRKIE